MINIGKNSLIIQPLPGIGDLIWHLPHIHAIAKQEGPVSLLTKSRSCAQDILKHDFHIKQVLWIERNPGRHDGIMGFFRLSRELGKYGFQKAWILHQSSRYVWLSRLAGIRDIRFLKEKPGESESDRHPIAHANRLLTNHGVSFDPEPMLYVSDEAVQSICQRFSVHSTPWIGVGIGTSEPYKQWGASRFAELIHALHTQNNAATFFVVGGKAEETLAQQIVQVTRKISAPVVLMVGQPMQEVMALLKLCRILVSNDTGVLHIAAAVQTPVVGLFGRSPLDYSEYIHPVLPEGAPGMAGISVGLVLRSVLEYL